MGNEKKGFASMTKERVREIASQGGKAAHAKGTAHRFTKDEARIAGRKGGLAAHKLASVSDVTERQNDTEYKEGDRVVLPTDDAS